MGVEAFSSQSNRRVEADGQVWIICTYCTRKIQKITYGMFNQRFSTATCYQCQKGMDAGKTPDELVYEAVQAEMKQAEEATDAIGPGMFRALGMRRKITEVAQEIKKRIITRRRKITED
jgi:hypothetical protein